MPQTTDAVQATWSAARSSLVGYLQPQSYARRVILMAVRGPSASTLDIYRGYVPDQLGRITRVFPADSRTYDADQNSAPIIIRAGEAAVFEWTGGSVSITETANATVVSEWGGIS